MKTDNQIDNSEETVKPFDKMTKEEQQQMVETDEDFILSKKHDYSLDAFMAKNPKGTNDKVISGFLMRTPEQVQSLYESAINKIRQHLKTVLD